MMQAALPWPEEQTVALTRLLWRFSLMLTLTNIPDALLRDKVCSDMCHMCAIERILTSSCLCMSPQALFAASHLRVAIVSSNCGFEHIYTQHVCSGCLLLCS